MSSRTASGAWWHTSRRSARRTAVAGGALVAVLATISGVIWMSPDTGLSRAVVQGVIDQALPDSALSQRSKELQGQINALSDTVVRLKGAADSSSSELAQTQGELARTKQALADAQQALAQAQASSGGEGAGSTAARAGSSGQPVSASGSTSSHGTTTGGTTPAAAQPATVTAPSKAQLVAPAARYFGLYTEQAPFNFATFDDTAAKAGRTPNTVGYFQGWDQPFRPDAVTASWKRGALPVLTWESRPIAAANNVVDEPDYSLPRIIGDPATGTLGAFDDYLRQYARGVVATGLPLAIRLDQEMNATWYPWSEDDGHGKSINGNRTGDFVKMWQHVHDVFQQEGANDLVIWVWAPNRVDKLTTAHRTPEYLASLYPGDDYVDWVGMSGYLRPPYASGATHDFAETFAATLGQLRALSSKPIFLAEVGASETGGAKAAWLASFFDALADPANADIIGFSWFNLAITSFVDGERSTNDWRIQSRADSLAAFRTGIGRADIGFALTPSG